MNAEDRITVHVDGHARPLPAGSSLDDLVTALGHAPADVGTAVNGLFVPRALRAAHVLNADDAVLLFQPIVGG